MKKNLSGSMFFAAAVMCFTLFAGSLYGQLAVGKRIDEPKLVRSSVINAGKLIDDIKYLASDELEGRSPAQESIVKARAFVKKRFNESGIKPFGENYEQEFEVTRRGSDQKIKAVNYVGLIKGKKNPEKYIVITAHYDHVGKRGEDIYNGADDNASGTAALFALGEYFSKKKPDHSLIFVAFDAEEMGLQGARHFVGNLPVAKESILLNINMDMISRNDKDELYAAGSSHYPHLKVALEATQKKAKVKLLIGHDIQGTGREDWTFQSDHGAFHREKIPFIYFGVEDHADYHRPTDTFDKIQPDFYIRAVETIIETVKIIDKTKH